MVAASLAVVGFQFLYGAIGRSNRSQEEGFYLVSIPIWCDWKDTLSSCSKYSLEFQFLYGAIGRTRVPGAMRAEGGFQFLYGAIGSFNV